MNDEAIPAATLILVRDRSDEPPQLLMVERAAGMAFAAGAWVFPGGRIDEEDEILGRSFDVDHAAARVAAIRETIEETAIPAGLAPMTWSGKGKDIGLYAASVGDKVEFYYDPADPSNLDTAAMKGWRGGLLLDAATGGFAAFYIWFFWLRGRSAR